MRINKMHAFSCKTIAIHAIACILIPIGSTDAATSGQRICPWRTTTDMTTPHVEYVPARGGSALHGRVMTEEEILIYDLAFQFGVEVLRKAAQRNLIESSRDLFPDAAVTLAPIPVGYLLPSPNQIGERV